MTTLLGVFRDRDEPDAVLDRLSEHGIDREGVSLALRETTVSKVEDIEMLTYVDHFESPGTEAKKGALGGLLGGAAVGAGAVLLATLGILIAPDVTGLLGSQPGLAAVAAAAVAGAVGGFASGALIGALLGAADHDATKVKTVESQVRDVTQTNGFVVTIEVDVAQSEEMSVVLYDAGADEVSLLGSDETHFRIQLD